jgi:hypothetical protein
VPRAPSGEARKGPSGPNPPTGGPQAPSASRPAPGGPARADGPPSAAEERQRANPEDLQHNEEELRAVQEQLLRTPAELVVANHAMGLWDLAALHLSHRPPQLAQARLAIDALAALLEGLRGRLGEAEATLVDGLTQIRMAFVQVANAKGQAGAQGADNAPAGG